MKHILETILRGDKYCYIDEIISIESFLGLISVYYEDYKSTTEAIAMTHLLEQSKKGWYGKTKGIPYIDEMISKVILIMSPTVD